MNHYSRKTLIKAAAGLIAFIPAAQVLAQTPEIVHAQPDYEPCGNPNNICVVLDHTLCYCAGSTPCTGCNGQSGCYANSCCATTVDVYRHYDCRYTGNTCYYTNTNSCNGCMNCRCPQNGCCCE